MKIAIALAASLLLLSSAASARDTYVNGYVRSNGTYVGGHHRTTPDNTMDNNYSTRGNTNPYTGQAGTVSPQPSNNWPSSGYGNYGSNNSGQNNTYGTGSGLGTGE